MPYPLQLQSYKVLSATPLYLTLFHKSADCLPAIVEWTRRRTGRDPLASQPVDTSDFQIVSCLRLSRCRFLQFIISTNSHPILYYVQKHFLFDSTGQIEQWRSQGLDFGGARSRKPKQAFQRPAKRAAAKFFRFE